MATRQRDGPEAQESRFLRKCQGAGLVGTATTLPGDVPRGCIQAAIRPRLPYLYRPGTPRAAPTYDGVVAGGLQDQRCREDRDRQGAERNEVSQPGGCGDDLLP